MVARRRRLPSPSVGARAVKRRGEGLYRHPAALTIRRGEGGGAAWGGPLWSPGAPLKALGGSGNEMLSQRIHQYTRPEAYHVGSRQTRLILRLLQNIPGFLFAQANGHNRETNNLARAFRPHPAYSILVDSNHALQRRQRAVGIALDSGFTRLVTKDHSIWHRTMYQAQCHRRVTRMIERTLPLDEHPVVFVRKIEHHLLYHTRHKITDDAVHRQPVTRNHNPRLAGSDESAIDSPARCFLVHFQGCRHFSRGAVRAYHEDSIASRAMWNKLSNAILLRWPAHIPDRHAMFFCRAA